MSKLDAQRAMREANYARNRASGSSRRDPAPVGGAATPPARTPSAKPAHAAQAAPIPAAAAPTAAAATATAPTAAAAGERCGHKSMNGRVCTREAAHSEKNHRYS
jgi:hypothetical protein